MTEEDIEEIRIQTDANTEMIKAILSGLLDKTVKYRTSESWDTYAGEDIRYPSGNFVAIDGKNKAKGLAIGDIEAKICLLTGGHYDSETGKCKHK